MKKQLLIDKSREKEGISEQRSGIIVNQLFFNLSNFVAVIGLSPQKKIKKALSSLILITLIVTVTFPLLQVSESRAQGNPFLIRQIRVMESETTGLVSPAGLTFSGKGNAFHLVDARPLASTDLDVVRLTSLSERVGSIRIAATIQNPINMVFDNRSNRLLFLHGQANQLLAVPADADGSIYPGNLVRYDIKSFGLQNPQGMTVDEASGTLFILDAKAPRFVKVDPASDGSFNGAEISEIDLQSLGLSTVRGLALDPVSAHLFVINPQEQTLYELTQSGELISTRDLKPFRLKNPQAMIFAPSGDQTDDPLQMSLYMADSGLSEEQDSTFALRQTSDAQETGQIIEFSLTPAVESAAASFSSSLIKTTDMAAISPPGPDPSGIAYLPTNNTLLIVDGEVEEIKSGITHFSGANVWELTLSGSKVSTANISKVEPTATPMTNEPTGVAFNPTNGHYYVTDDEARKVYDLNPGMDGSIGTADDTWASFSTLDVASGDPEGIAFSTWNNHVFVVDGMNEEVYEFTTSGTLINQFDVQQYGVGDPEGIEFNPDTGTLFTLSSSRSNPIIIETTTSGELLQTINISATNHRAAAGLAYAPASDGSGERRFYIVDRGIDNNDDPRIIDGKVYEITAPVSGSTPTPSATFTATSTSPPSPSPTLTRTASPTPLPPTPSPTFTLTASPTSLPPTPSPTLTLTASPTSLPPSPLPEVSIFTDVPLEYWSWEYIERLYKAGVTTGCSSEPVMFCPTTNVTRDQMAVFLLRGKYGASYTPPLATGIFQDVPQEYWSAAWIEQLAAEGITSGCNVSPKQYCPATPVTRDQMAVFLLRAKHGSGYVPPQATGIFQDVPQNHWAAAWIEQLAAEGITAGCSTSPMLYCPITPVTRDQMAVFLVKNFTLP